MKHWYLIAAAILLLTGCGTPYNPAPTSDSAQRYSGGTIPVDLNAYLITGTVVADVGSIDRFQSSGSMYTSSYGGSGSYFSETSGKGFVRLTLESLRSVTAYTTTTVLAKPGDNIIIKTTDSKATVLLPGDRVQFKCRAQYETLAAVREGERFEDKDVEPLGTWEYDYCRLASPVIGTAETE